MVHYYAMRWMAPLLLAMLSLSCSRTEQGQSDRSAPKQPRPLAEYTGQTLLDMHEGSRLSWTLRTSHLVRQSAADLVRAKPVHLTVYDTTGREVVWVTSDSGAVDEQVNFLSARGNVHVRSAKGVLVDSDSLRWNKATDQISTEAKVRVVSEDGDTLTGKGFISDARLDRWQILGEVRGVFQKVQERIGPAVGDSSASGEAPAGAPTAADSALGTPSPGGPGAGGSAASEGSADSAAAPASGAADAAPRSGAKPPRNEGRPHAE